MLTLHKVFCEKIEPANPKRSSEKNFPKGLYALNAVYDDLKHNTSLIIFSFPIEIKELESIIHAYAKPLHSKWESIKNTQKPEVLENFLNEVSVSNFLIFSSLLILLITPNFLIRVNKELWKSLKNL